VGAGALVFGCTIFPTESLSAGPITDLLQEGFPLNPFVSMKLDGTIIIMAHRSEMGQGIKSSLAAVLADELEADWSRVRLEQADADAPRYAIGNPNQFGKPSYLIPEEVTQFADSSRSMALYYLPMRLFGAGIRLVMEKAAARKWGVDPAECRAEQHKVYHKGNKHRPVAYNHLLLYAAQVGVPQIPEITAALKTPDQWRFIGKMTMPFVDAQDMVTGKAVYGADVDPKRPGMLTAMIVRCPVANGEVKSYDDTEARKVPGVVDVVKVRLPMTLPAGGVGAGFNPHAGVAVLAENTWAAWQGRRALKPTIEWELEGNPNAEYDSKAFRAELEASTADPGRTLRSRGDVDAAFAQAAKVVEADYYVPHLAQAPMEPPAAVALYENGRWEIWSPTQGPDFTQHYVGLAMLEPDPVNWLIWQVTDPSEARECEQEEVRDFNEELGRYLKLDLPTLIKRRDELKKEIRDRVKVHTTLLGGGFGRKSKCDYAIEAAFLARERPGVPIRVQWTREDDIQFSYYNSVAHQRLKAALDGAGHTTALQLRSAFTSFFATLFPPPEILPEPIRPVFAKARTGYHSGGEYPFGSGIERAHGLEDMMYDVESLRIENCPAQNHIRCGWMRSVANIYHAFGTGSFADELAIAAGRDAKDYLLELIGKGRVLDLAAEGSTCFDNNGFPALKWEGTPAVIPPYPPDTRRLRAVVERVAKEAGWDEKVQQYKQMKGRGLGIAAHRAFLSYVAIVVDVSLNEANELTINEIHGAIDCGLAVNPDRCIAQMEGGILYGLSYALLGEITVKKGAVEQNNFDDYPVLRIHQTPKKPIAVYFVEPSAESIEAMGGQVTPTGVGEPPTPAVAPALANAIVAAGGPRIREIPFFRKVVVL
jgi:isoquinoline 1-oxidoreductase beta subunit